MNPLSESIETLGLASPWTYVGLFLAASLLMLWRFESLQKQGLEGTALGTLVMPYCSGLGNLLFVWIVASTHAAAQEVVTNCLVNNVTNLTLILGLPALIWGLDLNGTATKTKKAPRKKSAAPAAETARRVNRLSLLLTLGAVLFFTGVTWALAADGVLDASDGLVLIALFLFWQTFQIFDVLKHNVTRRKSFGPLFFIDVIVLLAGAYVVYVSLDWLVTWLTAQRGGFLNAQHLGWLSGWLMVVPNALLAFYYGAKRRADIVYASQVGDGHICIPLCLGLSALVHPLPVPKFMETGLAILIGAALVHLACIAFAGRLPRWLGWPLLAGYAWFVGAGLMGP